jgi:hypothetical protein
VWLSSEPSAPTLSFLRQMFEKRTFPDANGLYYSTCARWIIRKSRSELKEDDSNVPSTPFCDEEIATLDS